MLTKELIERFFKNKCTLEEQEQVMNFFKSNPDLFEKHLNEKDWENFETPQRLNPALSRKLRHKVQNNTYRRKTIVRPITKIAVAASIVLVLTLGLTYFKRNSTQLAHTTIQDPKTLSPQFIQKTNTTDRTLALIMTDGSLVQLEPNSTISYHEPFIVEGKRIIQLTGQASFKVAKDKTRPFTVFADGIATTALGTQFTIRAFDNSNIISVALHEGRVVVNSSELINNKLEKNYFLLPGDVFVYNKTSLLASINRTGSDNIQMVAAATDRQKNGVVRRPEWYTFKSASLAEVFNQLSIYYQVDIYYYPDEIKRHYYTGKIEKTDSLETILNDIALLNRLIVAKDNGKYLIQKKIK
jgi:transmembrane sensor